jgi:tetratricopeptide (TPR) repeat protein
LEGDDQRTYLDSALYVHDVAVDSLRAAGVEVDPFDWAFAKGRFIQKHNQLLPDRQTDVGGIYREAYDLDHTRLQNYYINYIIADLVSKDQKGDAVDFMDIAEADFANDADVLTTIETWRGQLFTSPEERIGFLESQIEKNPDDGELKTELLQLYMDEGIRDMAYQLADEVMNDAPSARLYRTVAKMRLDDGDTDEAIRLYEESLSMEGGSDAAREVYYNIGIAHQQEGRLASARTQFRRAIETDPTYVQALIAIGDLYVTAVQGCGTFEREDRAVYWLAADYFDRAAARAENDAYANQARQRRQNIQRFFPTAEDKFFKNWNPGDRYTINYGCYTWIGETTTVR